MDLGAWPEQDQRWVTRYRQALTGKHVPEPARLERERELLEAVRDADVPAVELFGAAELLAAEDAAELATPDEAVRTSTGAGLRPALHEVGGTLTGLAAVASLVLLVRHGWSVDVGAATVLLAASVAVPYVAWAVSRALFSGGRPVASAAVLVSAVTVAVAGIATAVGMDGDPLVGRVSVPLLGLGLLAPGVLVLVVASRLPEPVLRADWDDAEWLRRFSGGLRTQLVPAEAARGHVDEVRQAVERGTTSAVEEFGHPLALARQLAEADRTARLRRWWTSVLAGTGTPMALAALVHLNDSWGALTTPLVVVLVLVAVLNLLVASDGRPWRDGR